MVLVSYIFCKLQSDIFGNLEDLQVLMNTIHETGLLCSLVIHIITNF